MEFENVVNERRSIRRFKDIKVDKNKILHMIETAQKAPSWKNSQTSRYYVVEELGQDVIDCLPEFNQISVSNAPTLIVCTVVEKRSGHNRDGEAETHLGDGFTYFDNGLQVQNLVLQAQNLGLGTLIMGLYDNKRLRKVLSIPKDETITVVIAVGYPDIEPNAPQRKDINDIVTFM